jgi:hypothetical protein
MDEVIIFMIGMATLVSCCVVAIASLLIVHHNRRQHTTSSTTAAPTGSSDPPGGGESHGESMKNGAFSITNYWVASDGDSYLMDCGSSKPKKAESKKVHKKEVVLGSAPGGPKYQIRGKDGGALVDVDAYTWDACYCEGTCRIGSNTYNLLSENKQTFMKTDAPYGLGSKGNHLTPFVSVTADGSFPHGTTLFVNNIKGATLPNGKIHNGCVRVDDNCGDGCGSKQLDLHVGTYDLHKQLKGRLQGKSDVTKQSCQILEYL